MSEGIIVEKKPKARYFGQRNDDDSSPVERIKVDSSKKAKSFEGEVINVSETSKFFKKYHLRNGNKGQYGSKFDPEQKGKINRGRRVKIKIDPYALERHSRKIGFSTF